MGHQLLRGFAIMLCIVPSVGLALNGFQAAELRYASGLFNLMRNLGGAIGIATVNTWLQDDTRIDASRIGQALGESGRRAPDFIAGLAAQLARATADPDLATRLARGEFAQLVGRVALTSAFNDVFRLMAWMFIAAIALAPFCRPLPSSPVAPAEAH
jgi:DHA2 family multidrug resistance protein